jgi:hypothetical protein
MRKILNKELPTISKKLGIGNPELWKYTASPREHPYIYRVIFHYDLLLNRFYRDHAPESYEKDDILGILEKSNEITFITFYARPEVLVERMKQRNRKIFTDLYRTRLRILKMFLKIYIQTRVVQRFYTNSDNLYSVYREWLEFCGKYKAKAHWIIDSSDGFPKLLTLSQWLDETEGIMNNTLSSDQPTQTTG